MEVDKDELLTREPSTWTEEELYAAVKGTRNPFLLELLSRLGRVEKVTATVTSGRFLRVADDLQKAVMGTMNVKECSPALCEAMFAYNGIRVEIAAIADGKKETL